MPFQEKRFSLGIIEALRLTHNHAWIELIMAFGKEHVRFDHNGIKGQQSRGGGDDFLVDIGYNILLDKKGRNQLLLHWLTGIPTHWDVTSAEIAEPLLGTRTYATGPVIEYVHDFIRNDQTDFFIGCITRFLHRFKRHYEPILPADAFYRPGNEFDFLTLVHYRYYGQNFECGYVRSSFNHIFYQLPQSLERIPSEKFNSFYLDYFYYSERLSMGFEFNITRIIGNKEQEKGLAFYGLIGWYF